MVYNNPKVQLNSHCLFFIIRVEGLLDPIGWVGHLIVLDVDHGQRLLYSDDRLLENHDSVYVPGALLGFR